MKLVGWGLLLLLIAGTVSATEYEIIVADSGESLVFIRLQESGTFTLPLPEDVAQVKVKGALYLLENNQLELSIGSTEQAVIAYTSHSYTSKEKEVWHFSFAAQEGAVKVHLPKEVTIQATEPKAFIEETDFKTISWDTSAVSISYQFGESSVEEFTSTEQAFPIVAVTAAIALVLLGIGIVLFLLRKPASKETAEETLDQLEKDSQSQKNVIKTLSGNERKVVELLLEHEGSMKRNDLEKKSQIAKSSLASSLKNLEQKNIVEIDRTYTVHFVKLTEWFTNL